MSNGRSCTVQHHAVIPCRAAAENVSLKAVGCPVGGLAAAPALPPHHPNPTLLRASYRLPPAQAVGYSINLRFEILNPLMPIYRDLGLNLVRLAGFSPHCRVHCGSTAVL